MHRLAIATLALTILGSHSIAAQTIRAGMTRAQVVALLGRPVGERKSDDRTYLFYHNGCLKKCGADDVVMLERDTVFDAVLRGKGRTFAGARLAARPAPTRHARVPLDSIFGDSPAAVPGGIVTGDSARPDAGARRTRRPPASNAGRAEVVPSRVPIAGVDDGSRVKTRADTAAAGAQRGSAVRDSTHLGRTPSPSAGRALPVDSTRLGRSPAPATPPR